MSNTEQEKIKIKEEIFAELVEQGFIKPPQSPAQPLRDSYNKWFSGRDSKFSKITDRPYVSYKIWECIRILTCKIMGVSRLSQLSQNENADQICELLCQYIYDLQKLQKAREN